MINISELINDPDFTQPNGVIVERTSYIIENHMVVGNTKQLKLTGIITIADDTSIEKTPEFDSTSEKIHVFTYTPLYVTGKPEISSSESFLSDVVIFEGNPYSVDSCLNDSQYGFCRSTCSKIRRDVM